MKLSNLPYKGTLDLYGDEFALQQYIFRVWREVCEHFNYQPYLTPVLETAELYRAKSGEDVGGKELFTLRDLANRDLSLRPEMTPSVTRMVTRFYPQQPKPLRLYSIANFFRNERPQRGRNREFWQLNADIFGDESFGADLEVLLLALEIMKTFGATKEQFVLYVNSRLLINELLDELQIPEQDRSKVARAMDKFAKLSRTDFGEVMDKLGLAKGQIDQIIMVMEADQAKLSENFPKLLQGQGWQEVTTLLNQLRELTDFDVQYAPHLIRGFDYYDGMIFEVFDKHPDNNRAIFGGGRYNGLAGLFGSKSFPAVGFAPGDEPMKLFLRSWNLLPQSLQEKPMAFVPQLLLDQTKKYWQITTQLREMTKQSVTMSTGVLPMNKALSYANQHRFAFIILMGEHELQNNLVTIKDLTSGKQETIPHDSLPYWFND